MTQNAEDLRVRRTRKLLQKALLEATTEKGFAHVTVRDLTERAMVNRATFYRHFQDKHDLLRQYIEELSGRIGSEEDESARDGPPGNVPPSPHPGLVHLLKHMRANANFYQVMLGPQGDPAFCARSFRPYIEQGFRRMVSGELAPADAAHPPLELVVSYLLQAGVGAIVWWLEAGQANGPEQMANWLYQLSLGAIGAALGVGGPVPMPAVPAN
jgi:AcrR family transcriptional regulator